MKKVIASRRVAPIGVAKPFVLCMCHINSVVFFFSKQMWLVCIMQINRFFAHYPPGPLVSL